MQHTFLRREAGGTAERINKSRAPSKVHHNVRRLWWNSQILFISTRAVCCRSGSLWFAHIVNALNKFPLQKMAAWIASHGKMGVLGDGLRDRTDRKKRDGERGVIGEWRRTDTLIIETIKSKNKSFFLLLWTFQPLNEAVHAFRFDLSARPHVRLLRLRVFPVRSNEPFYDSLSHRWFLLPSPQTF